MKTKIIVCLTILSTIQISCKKEDAMLPIQKPLASFEIKKEILDDGEKIVISNTSINAEHFIWEIGNNILSKEKHPSIKVDLEGMIWKEIPITLSVISSDGDTHRTNKIVKVGSRVFQGFTITQMSEKLREGIASNEISKSSLIVQFGLINEIDGWSPNHHWLPEAPFCKNVHLPYIYVLEKDSPIYMNNQEWYIRLSTRIDGQKTPTFLKEFRFNPSKQKAYQYNRQLLGFTLKDDEMTMEILFVYASK